MEFIILLLVLLAISALSVPYGVDSRGLSDRAAHRDSLWSR
jgi:hypothetical protein